VRAYGDPGLVAAFVAEVPAADRQYLLDNVLRGDELRVYNGEATPAQLRAEALAADPRTPDSWRQWLQRSRQLFAREPERVAEQYFFLSETGRSTVYFAMTAEERAALRRLRERRWRDLNIAFSEQRLANRQRREPVEQTA
jgi:hypothetical protein